MGDTATNTSKKQLMAGLNEKLRQTGGRSSIDFQKAKTTLAASLTERQHNRNKKVAKKASPFGRCPNVSLRYEKLGRIGEGTYGIVYKARDNETKEFVALKRCLPHHESSDGFPLTTLREITTLRQLKSHPNIVRLQQVAVSSRQSGVFLVFEHCEHDLAYIVDSHYNAHKKSPFRESEVKRLALQLLSALEFVHKRHFLHRDIKLSNLLYNSKGELRLADFGLSRKFTKRMADNPTNNRQKNLEDGEEGLHKLPKLTPKVVSLWYRPPELLFGSEVYDEGVDNWGAGCVIGELLLGAPLINGANELDQISKMFDFLGAPTLSQWPSLPSMPLIQNGTLEIPRPQIDYIKTGKSFLDRFSHLSTAGLSLLGDMLQYDYQKRLTAKDALESKYFSEVPIPVHVKHMPRFPSKPGT